MGISRIWVFLSCLLIADALTLPNRQGTTNPEEFYQGMTMLMGFVMPIATMTMAFKTVSMTAGMNAFMQMVESMESVMTSAITTFGSGTGESLLSTITNGMPGDRCLQRLVCEMAIGNQRRRKRDVPNTMHVKSFSQGNIPQQRIVIDLNLSSQSSNPSSTSSASTDSTMSSSTSNTCERLFRSCPYGAQDMLDALRKYISVWRQVRIPRLMRPYLFEPLDLNRIYNIFD